MVGVDSTFLIEIAMKVLTLTAFHMVKVSILGTMEQHTKVNLLRGFDKVLAP